MCAAGRAANVMLEATASLQRQPAIQMHGGLVQIIGSVHRLGLAVWLWPTHSGNRLSGPSPSHTYMRPTFPGRPGATLLTSRVALRGRPGAKRKVDHMEAFIPMMADFLVLLMAMCSS